MHPILIVDDEVEMRIAMSETLKHCGYPVEVSHNALDALNKFKKNDYAMVVTDMTMPKRSGLELLKDIKALDPEIPVLMVTAYATIETAIEAMKHGAFEYIQKPFKSEVFTFKVDRALHQAKEKKPAARAGAGKKSPATQEKRRSGGSEGKEMITADHDMLQLLGVAENVAQSKATILVQSESGTGKELLARFIHERSDRADGPFVAVNCAALPDTLLESELFGHRKGAFTGAIQDHKGRFEQASGGTILLDEISEMALPLQAKLLRVLQEYEVDRIGGKEPIPVDVRVIATTNRDLFAFIEEGKFREDLYYRLNVIPLILPPLRDRKGDIPLLAGHFVKMHAAKNGRGTATILPEAMEVLCHYNWRGNVRELENVMERALLLCGGKEIEPAHLMMNQGGLPPNAFGTAFQESSAKNIAKNTAKGSAKGSAKTDKAFQATEKNAEKNAENGAGKATGNGNGLGITVGMSMKEAEKKLIFETLRETSGNRTQAAKVLSISIRTLRNKLNEYAADGDGPDFELRD
ncbi:MAG: sigma-54-dependent Fis family transcriptional regulator [SAR324 cluster bacterium]|nr:sigma-54-dependent Fis family transcriptional regulator [SAR324 cluster bacterium]